MAFAIFLFKDRNGGFYMGVYVGYVEKKGYEPTVFFNFTPIAEIRDSQIIELTFEEKSELLPESEKGNINFTYSWNDDKDKQRMDATFREKALVIFEFTLSDLEDNFKTNGDRNQTGYKVQAIEMIDTGKIRPIDSENIYYAIKKEDILSDFYNDAVVDIESPFVIPNAKVFVELGDFWAGPYKVGFRDYTSSYYIKPQIKDNKYIVNGYTKGNFDLKELTISDGYWGASETVWSLFIPRKGVGIEQQDVISDETLIESFRDSIENSMINEGQVQLDDIPALLERYKNTVLTGAIITENVRRSRLNRLISILTSDEDVDETLNLVTGFICDLLVKYKNSPNVEEWLQLLVEKHPELVDQLKESQTISERITQMELNLTELKQQRADLEKEIEEKRLKAESIDQAAIEAKKREMLEMDAEYTELSDRLKNIKNILCVGEDIAELQKKQNDIKREVDYLENHKRRLEQETNGLELQFQQLISKPHEKMVNIAFDGFMASKMLNAAAKWENEQVSQQHENLVDKINDLYVQDKSPEELVDYLCHTVQIVRPTYSNNTIINIAICLSQGFLTVFSGEPGCGKTSICNIFGQVLGLNKIAELAEIEPSLKESGIRYIPISVERGWTSKRDFVGYFNPLSKTFDKSNRRVYEALHQLDTEKQKGICKFPYIILLDEANLSPMEYYWSDFMNICDDLGTQSNVNLGENYIFGIPETLHFLATINNDHTTETMSPRLIDRAWIVTLPQQNGSIIPGKDLTEDEIEVITWASLQNAFVPQKEECRLSAEVQKIYDNIVLHLRKYHFIVSPRIDMAIKKYWAAASKRFEVDDTKTDPFTIALDYAVAQRILPKIIGNGEEFEHWLEEFRSICSSNSLNMCAKILRDIIDRGNQQMKYYQFFI